MLDSYFGEVYVHFTQTREDAISHYEMSSPRPKTWPSLDGSLYSPYASRALNDCNHLQYEGSVTMSPERKVAMPSQARTTIELPLKVGYYEGTATVPNRPGWYMTWWLDIQEVYTSGTWGTITMFMEYRWYTPNGDYYGGGSSGTWPVTHQIEYCGSFSYKGDNHIPAYKEWDIEPSTLMLDDLVHQADLACRNTPMDWGQLCMEATSSIRSLDLNGLAFLKESFSTVKALYGIVKGDISSISRLAPTQVIQLLKEQFSAPKAVSRQIAKDVARGVGSDYLATHYGVRLSLYDYADVAKHIERQQKRFLYQRAYAKRSMELPYNPVITSGPTSYTRWMNATVRSYSDDILRAVYSTSQAEKQLLQRIQRSAYELDLVPSLENIWDLVPFSFVVDWFLPLGDQLAALEAKNYASTLPVITACYTEIFEWSRSAPSLKGWQASGELHFRYYRRRCTRDLVTPRLISPDSPLPSLPKHWVEGAALITQLFK